MTKTTEGAPLTMAEVCEELNVSRSTFYAWRATRQAPRCIKLPNGQIRVRRDDLEQWLQTREDTP
jgi:excisionase family DNA binding protein